MNGVSILFIGSIHKEFNMMKEKSTRRKEQGEATKKKLFEAAQRLFIEHGVDNVSVDNIVEAVGVARGTFYVHYESKDALISSMIYGYTDKADMDYEAFLKTLPPDASSAEILFAMTGKICDVIEHTVGYDSMRILYKVQLNGMQHMQAALNYNRALYQMFAAVLEKGIARGEFQPTLPADELSRHLILALRGLTYEWCIRYPDFNLKEQAIMHFKVLLDGIKVRGKA